MPPWRTVTTGGHLWSANAARRRSTDNRHNVMPLKSNPSALIQLWKYSKQSDCAFCWQHTTLDQLVSKSAAVLNVILCFPTRAKYANASEFWIKLFGWIRNTKTKPSIHLSHHIFLSFTRPVKRALSKQVIRSGPEPAHCRRHPSPSLLSLSLLSVTMALLSLSHLPKLCGNR